MRITIPDFIKSQIDSGRVLIAHAYAGRYEYGLADLYAEYFKGTDYPGPNKDAYYCYHCNDLLSFDQLTIILAPDAGNSQEPYTEEHQGADARLGATHAVLFRNLVSEARVPGGNIAVWLEALFTLRNGYERRLASEEEWEEFGEHMHEMVQNALIAEHEDYLNSMGVGL